MTFPHHNSETFIQSDLMKRFLEERAGTARREFPEGRISGDDDGLIVFTVSADPEKEVVKIEFSKPMVWAAMSPQQAVEFAQLLIKRARSISKGDLLVVLH